MGRITFTVGNNFHVSNQLRARANHVLKWLMQRMPITLHFGILLLAFVGPVLAPRLLAFMLLFAQTAFSGAQMRSAWGLFCCWIGVRQHAQTDWTLYWSDQKAKLERDGLAHNVLPWDSIQNVIIVPAYKEEMSTLKEVSPLVPPPCGQKSCRMASS